MDEDLFLIKLSSTSKYSQFFSTVEINSTFYNLPSIETVKNWGKKTPKNFLFSVKASRFITHQKKLLNPEETLPPFFERIKLLKHKLGPILFQLPPSFKRNLERLEELTGKHLDPIHIIGGGTKNRLLNQFTADSTRRTVITGPVEATAIGNILMQAIGIKHLGSLAEAREIVRASFEPEIYEPNRKADWDEAYVRLQKVMKHVAGTIS